MRILFYSLNAEKSHKKRQITYKITYNIKAKLLAKKREPKPPLFLLPYLFTHAKRLIKLALLHYRQILCRRVDCLFLVFRR